jgi:hypothetical protein
MRREPKENPDYSDAEKHAPKGRGDVPSGSTVHGTYKQPWVDHDGVTDPHGDLQIG